MSIDWPTIASIGVAARKEELIELMKERIGSLTNNEGDNDAAAQ